uniref:si:ch211-119e14.1 n=1 Tax=Danio rerio TaxID=7955 RepID=UPI003F9FD93E
MASGTVDSTPTVLALLFIWVILVLALVYFYRKLNTETNGQYTVQRMVFAPGGLRDQLRQGVGVVENRFDVHIWPQPREDEENIRDKDEDDENDQDKQNDTCTEEREQENQEDKDEDSSSDYSSVDLRERAKMQKAGNKNEEKEDEEEKPKEEVEKKEEEVEDDKAEDVKKEEKVGLLVDLKPFTGSAIWSEESKEKKEGNDFTAL